MMISASVLLVTSFLCLGNGQIINRPPSFIPGSGDMSRFSLSENMLVGSPVYQLKGSDPEGSKLRYSISGPVFSVDRDTGVVRLRQKLDREQQDLVEVIISITDEGVLETEPNTVSLRREIPIRDYNDNPPVFQGRPYSASISEATKPGTVVKINPDIVVSDRDEGINSELSLSCYTDPTKESDNICEVFNIKSEKIGNGKYSISIILKKPLDYETRPSYVLTILAEDRATVNPLSSMATVAITILDIQDQPPIFVNAPFSVTIPENTPKDTSVLLIKAMDGDTGNPRPILLTLENEYLGHFKLEFEGSPHDGIANLVTTDKMLDREDPRILQNGGVYTFNVRATELINHELPGDFSVSQITVVLTDVDDHIPTFNKESFDISIPENLEQDTPLPGLAIIVTDKDLGNNSKYQIKLVNVENSEGVFAVVPTHGEGRTPLTVKITDSSKLDYDVDDENLRKFIFDLVAIVDGQSVSKTRVTVNLQDANDNSPVFPRQNYHLKVNENSKRGFQIASIAAIDMDTGRFGKLTYEIKGFGAEFFYTDKNNGGIFVSRNLDYEEQKSYSLALVAKDGGGRETNANLLIDILDANDNYPAFESLEYTRTIREGATEFEPQFFVRATDIDGPQQGGGHITYSVEAENSISGHVFKINANSGEITITRPVSSMDTERGQYELLVVATDHGTPSLKNDTRVLIRVGISGNQRPIFKGHFSSLSNGAIPGPPSYRVSIPENARPGHNVTMVSATDPDGIDTLLTYKIVGTNSDNFVINENTGLITVARDARLDRDTNPESYAVVVNAIDAGFPIPETATTTVYVKIKDVNDKPPKFTQSAYTAYVSERTPLNSEVIKLTAKDTDIDSKLKYSIIEPIKATSKAGIQLSSTSLYDFKNAFAINEEDGIIYVNKTLDYNLVSVIMLTIKAEDVNAEYNKDKQFDTTEVTLYISSFKDTNPVFKHKGWTNLSPNIKLKIKEETPIGAPFYKLVAEDPVAGNYISNFELFTPDQDGFFSLNDRTGELSLRRRLDYESLRIPQIYLVVKAITSSGKRESKANLNITVENVNDNAPIFEKSTYRTTVLESAKFPDLILTIKAKDDDAILNDLDRKIGYNSISYSLTGSYSNLFTINNKTGEIKIAPNQTLDRERQSVLRFSVIAEDCPGKPTDTRRTTAEIVIDVLDINDNPPTFTQKSYTAVIPENSEVHTLVTTITARDPDEGPGGEIRYELLNEGEANGLLTIDPQMGEIRTRVPLTGKGRSEPYDLIIRAQDSGGQLPNQKYLSSHVTFTLYIGDVSANDGIPFFITPKVGQIANITENATIGSPVFQVIASDPDSVSTPSGTLRYRIQDDIEDAKSFRIDSITGWITTLKSLDRETKANYNIIIQVSDMGEPPQAATRVLRINVLDIDDHKPRFTRDIDSAPVELSVLEEQAIGTIVGSISALDEDIDENGAIDYEFIDGNELNMFDIQRTNDNQALITTAQILDREAVDTQMLTVKCYKFKSRYSGYSRRAYNKYDFSELRIRVKIVDIDDHLPKFYHENQTIGVRHNVPIDTSIATIKARDPDSTAEPINYFIQNISFVPQFYRRENETDENLIDLFHLNNQTGELRTTSSISNHVDGYFQLTVIANNSRQMNRFAITLIKIFVIRDKSLLRFVFARPPSEINSVIGQFGNEIREQLEDSNIELSLFDAQVLSKPDHSLDFSSTSSCFQLSRYGSALSPQEMKKILESNDVKDSLSDIYLKYSVHQIDSCSVKRNVAVAHLMTSSGTWLVILAGLIGVSAFIAMLSACCITRSYKRQIRATFLPTRVMGSEIYGSSATTPVLYAEPIYGAL